MLDYRVRFRHDPRNSTETQYHCPFHGEDRKPSARLYRDTNNCFCWYCRKSWDPVSFIIEKEGFSFSEAVRFITKKYNVDLSGIPDGPNLVFDKGKKEISQVEMDLDYLRRRVRELKKDARIGFEKLRAVVTAYYCILMESAAGSADAGKHMVQLTEKIKYK